MPTFTVRIPRCWASEGTARPFVKEVERGTPEHDAVSEYFDGCGGLFIPGSSVKRILRNENMRLYFPYAAFRESLDHGGNEKWLWHGTCDAGSIVDKGRALKPGYCSATLAALGIGLYAARDVRLCDYFAMGRGVEPRPGETRTVLLLRVAIGRSIEKARLLPGVPRQADGNGGPHSEEEWQAALRDPRNRMAPNGYDSVLYEGTLHELCWYQENQSFAAYVVEYTSTALAGDPYAAPLCYQLLPIDPEPSSDSCICRLPD